MKSITWEMKEDHTNILKSYGDYEKIRFGPAVNSAPTITFQGEEYAPLIGIDRVTTNTQILQKEETCNKKEKPFMRTTIPKPKKVIFSGPATTILWNDGTKTTVKCQEDAEYFDEEKGIAMCYLKKMLGNKGNYNNIFRKAMKIAVSQDRKD